MRAGAVVALLLALVACDAEERPESTSTPTTTVVPRALNLVETDVLKKKAYPDQRSNLPASFPRRDERFASPLADPPGVTVMAYRPHEGYLAAGRELAGEPPGWAGENVFFWSSAGEWRRLDLTELGFPESEHPGDDSYGVGRLSPDGLHWATSSRVGFVVVNLATGSVHRERLAAEHTVHYLRWLSGGVLQAVGHGRRNQQEAWDYDVSDRVLEQREWPASWSVGPDPSGTPVLFSGGRGGVRRTTWSASGADPTRVDLPFRYRVSGSPLYARSSYLLSMWKEPNINTLLAVDGATDTPVRALAATDLGYHWWVGDRVVLAAGDVLLSWDPASGDLSRLAWVPAMPPGLTEQQRGLLYWHADLAVDVVSLD